MANRYWRGGTGTWDATTTTNWSATSGGSGGASVPTSADSVFFDQVGTYTVNMTGTLNCLDLTMSAGTPVTSGSASLNIYGSLSTIGSSVNWQNSGNITFAATTTGKTIDTASSWFRCSVIFNGVGGGWTLLSSYNMRDTVGGASNYSTTLTNGALDLGGFSWSTNAFLSTNANTRSIAFGSGNINAQPSTQNGTTVLDLTNLTGFSRTGTGAFVTDNGNTITINGPTTGVTSSNAPNLTFAGAGIAGITMSATNIWNNLNFGSIGSSPSFTSNVYGTLTLTAGGGNPAGLTINMLGTGNVVNAASKTISALNINTSGTVTLSNNLSVTTCSLLSTNTGTFALNGQTLTCSGAVSHSGGFITFGVGAISCTTFTVSASAAMNFTSGTITASGGFIINSATASFTYTAGTLTIPSFTQTNGTVTLAANVTLPSVVTGTYTLTAGALNLNGFNLTTGIFSSAGGGVRSVAFGSNNIILASTTAGATVLAMATTNNFSFTGTGGFAANMSVTRTFNCGFSSNNPRLFINAGASIPTFSAGSGFETLDFTGSTCTPATVAVNVGSIILATGGTYTGLTVQHRDFDTGAGTITPNGKTIAAFTNITTLNTVTLAGALSCTVFTQTSGTINFATFNLTCSSTASYTAGTMNNIGTISCTTFTNNGTFSFNNGTITPSTSFVNSTGSFTYNSPAVLSAVPTFTHTAGTVTLGKNYALTATGTYTYTAGTLTLNNNTLTTGIFASNSVSTRAIAFGTGFISLAHTTAGQTVLSMATLTGYSWTGTGGFTAAMSVTRTFQIGTSTGGSSTTATNLFITSGASVPTLTAGSYFNILDFTGSTCAPAGTLFNVNTLVLASGGIYNTIGFAPQFNTTQTWTPQFSKQLGGFGVTNNATVTLGGTQNFIMGSVTTLTSGTLDLGGFDFEAKTFSSTNTNTRSIVFGSKNIILNTTTSGTTVLSMANATNFTWTGTGGFTNDGSAASSYDVPRTLVFGTTGGTAVNAPNLSIFSGSLNIVTLTTQSWFNNLNFTGSSCTVAGIINVSTLTLATGGTYTSLEPQFTRTQTWTPQFSKQLGGFGVNGSGITVTMGGTQSLIATATTTLTIGTLDLGGFDLTTGIFSSTNTNTRSIAFGTNNIILAHTTLGTAVLSCGIATGFTYTGTGGFTSVMSVTRTFTFGTTGGTSTNGPKLSITSGASIPTITTGSWFNTLNFTGSTCTPAATVVNINDLTLASGGTYTSLGVAMRGTGTITPTGKTISTLTINHTGTTTLAAALGCLNYVQTSGTIDFATFNLTCSSTAFYSTGTLNNIGTITCTTWTVDTGTFTLTSGNITPSTSFIVQSAGTFNYNGGTLSAVPTFSHNAGTVSFGKAYSLTAAGTYTLAGGSLTLNGFNLTTGVFASTGTTTRSIAFGTNNIILASTSVGATVLSFATATGFTYTGTGGFISDASITRTYVFGTTGGTATNSLNLTLTGSGTAIQTFTTNSWFNKLNFGTTAFTIGLSQLLNLNELTLSSGGTFTNLTATMRGTGTITNNGTAPLGLLIINSPGGTVTLASNLSVQNQTTLTAGTFNLNNFNLTCVGAAFNSNNANTRAIQFGTGSIILTASGVAVLEMTNATGFTWTGTGGFSSDATQNRTFTFGTTGGTSTNAPNLSLTSGVNSPTITTGSWFNILNFTGCTGAFSGSLNLNSLILDIGGTYTSITAVMVGTGTITPNGKTLAALTINTSGTTTLAGALIVSGATTSTLGTLALGVYNLTSGSFASTGSLTRSITGTNSIFTITGSGATAWSNASATGWTCSGITISMTSATAKTFAGGGATYPILSQGGSGALTITGSNSFSDITDTVQPCTITFTAATTTTVSAFTLSGTSGNLVTINSSTPGTRFNLVKTNGVVNTNYLSIQDSSVTGGSGWYAGSNSTNVSNNLGWIFSNWQPGNFLNFFDYNTSFTNSTQVDDYILNASYLVLGGGAGGCSSGNGGSPGGGAGGLIYRQSGTLLKNTQHVITIGAGGAGGPQVTSNPGANTTVVRADGYKLTALYGGGVTKGPTFVTNGLPGGSGGGASRDGSVGGTGIQPLQPGESGLHGFGNAGARLATDTGGGGGGAGGAASGSNGGIGLSFDISGTSQFYAGGGGGNNYAGGTHGIGGSGVGATAGFGASAVANTGSGGSGQYGGAGSSGSGSGGICIFKYSDTYPAAANTTGSPTITVTGGYRIYKFASSGTITF